VKRALLLSTTTGYQIRSFGEAAARLNVDLVFASDRCHQLDDPWMDHAIPVRFGDEVAALTAIRAGLGAPPDAILAVGDRPVPLAALVAASYGLPGNAPQAAAIARHKLAARTALAAGGLPTPRHVAMDIDGDAGLAARSVTYPAVVKPVALTGSRGVMRVDDPDQCAAAVFRLREILRSPDVAAERDPTHRTILFEEFIPGREFALEGLLIEGELKVLAIFDKPDPMDGPFFEETVYVTPSREPAAVTDRIASTIGRACRLIGLRHGPVHAECRVNDHGVYVLEVAARPIGGLCSRALRFVGGGEGTASLEEVLMRHALGENVSGWVREDAASGVMMVPVPRRGLLRGVAGVEAARQVEHVTDVRITAKADTLLVPLPEGHSYLGFIFAAAPEPAGVERALREAHATLEFDIEREVPVI
jgi:hypothetical protein